MHWLTRVVNGNIDEGVHRRFVKYSVGEFDGPWLEVSVRGRNVVLRGDVGYEDFIGWFLLTTVDENEECDVKGVIIGKACVEEMKEYGGKVSVKGEVHKINVEFSCRVGELREVYERYADECVLMLNIKTRQGNVRSKRKLEYKGFEEERREFCVGRLKLSEEGVKRIVEEVAPDFLKEIRLPFKSLLLENKFIVEEIIFPENRERLSAREVRLRSKRRGRVKRTLHVDGETFSNEVEFTA